MPADGRWDLIRRLRVKQQIRNFGTGHFNFNCVALHHKMAVIKHSQIYSPSSGTPKFQTAFTRKDNPP